MYGLIMSIYMFTVTLATSGINLAATKVISEEIELGNDSTIPNVVKRCFIYSLITGGLSFILLILFTPYICEHFLMNQVDSRVLYTLAVSLPFVSATSAINGYFLAKRHVFKTSISQIASEIIRIGVTFMLVCFLFPNNVNSSALAIIIGNTLSDIVLFIFLYLAYIKEKKHSKKTLATPKLTRRILNISVPIAITSYIRSGLNTLKQIIIPIRLKLSGISYKKAISEYGIICGMAMPVIMFPSVIVYSYSSLLVPEFSRFSVHEDKNILKKNIAKMFKITLHFSIAVAGILMCFGKDIGNLLYSKNDASWYIKIMAPLIVIMYLDNVIDSILKGLGKQLSVMYCNILDLIISVSFIYFLLPIFGSTGYIIVMYISEILNYSISVITLFKEIDLKFKYFEWVILPVICITSSIILTSIFNFSYLSTLSSLILKILICIVCYIALLLISSKKEKLIF